MSLWGSCWTNNPVIIDFLDARFMGPTWGPSGADRTQVGPMLAPWILLSGFRRLVVRVTLPEPMLTYWFFKTPHGVTMPQWVNLLREKAPFSPRSMSACSLMALIIAHWELPVSGLSYKRAGPPTKHIAEHHLVLHGFPKTSPKHALTEYCFSKDNQSYDPLIFMPTKPPSVTAPCSFRPRRTRYY